MPAADKIHDAVKNALIKDGWTITHDPYIIEYKDARLYADLGAERPLAAERAGRRIVVEIKSFLTPSPLHDLQNALGQYIAYRTFLALSNSNRQVYLAISDTTYAEVFGRESVQALVKQTQLALLVVRTDTQEVAQWTG